MDGIENVFLHPKIQWIISKMHRMNLKNVCLNSKDTRDDIQNVFLHPKIQWIILSIHGTNSKIQAKKESVKHFGIKIVYSK
jgi:hypothetical protein